MKWSRVTQRRRVAKSMEDSEDSEDSSVQQHSKRHSATTNNIESIHTYRRPWCSSSFISSTTSTTSTTLDASTTPSHTLDTLTPD